MGKENSISPPLKATKRVKVSLEKIERLMPVYTCPTCKNEYLGGVELNRSYFQCSCGQELIADWQSGYLEKPDNHEQDACDEAIKDLYEIVSRCERRIRDLSLKVAKLEASMG